MNADRTLNPISIVVAGTLAGLLAGVFTVTLPGLTLHVAYLFYVNTIFGVFVGNIFGFVFAVFAWVVLHERSVMRALGFVLSSSTAYVLAYFSALFLGAGHLSQRGGGAIANSPAWVFFVGGVIGAFVVLLAALLLYSDEHNSTRIGSLAARWSVVGGILGVVGWGFGPSLGSGILSLIDPRSLSLRPYANQDALYECSLYLVWQTGMGAVLGTLFSRLKIREDLATHVVSAQGSGSRIRSLTAVFICAVVAVLVFFGRMLPEQYRQARLDRARALHYSVIPSLNNLPKVLPHPPEEMLVLSAIGEYLPGPPMDGVTQPEIDPHTQLPVPSAQRYDVTYALHGAEGPSPAPRIEVHVREYPTDSWAEYMLNEYPLGVSADTPKSTFFGNRIFAETRFIKSWGNAFYVWSSANRLVCLQFFSLAKDVPPDEFLKAYLTKYPSSL